MPRNPMTKWIPRALTYAANIVSKKTAHKTESAGRSGSALISFFRASKIEKNAEFMRTVRVKETPRPVIRWVSHSCYMAFRNQGVRGLLTSIHGATKPFNLSLPWLLTFGCLQTILLIASLCRIDRIN